MSRLAHQAEILKLARFLDIDPVELRLLETVDAASVHQLREQATLAFYASDEHFFKRVVAASKLLPVPALALIAESVLGPLLCARVAGQMDVKRGVGIAKRLKTPFLADVCLSLDPNRTRELIAAIPVQQIIEVAQELVVRGEYITMGRFVDILGDDVIRAVIEAMQDNADLLRIAFFSENKQRLDTIISLLSRERLIAIIHTAASDADLWPEALGLMQHLSPAVRGELADLTASLEEEVLTSMAHSVRSHGLWGEVLPIVIDMGPEAQTRFANLPAVQDEAMLADIIAAASRFGVWPELLPLVRLMDTDGKARCARVAEHLDGEQLLKIADVAATHGLWPEVIELVRLMNDAQRLDTMALLGIAPARVIDSLVPAIEAAGAWNMINEAWSRMGAGARERLQSAADAQSLGHRIRPSEPAPALAVARPVAVLSAAVPAAAQTDLKPLLAQTERQMQQISEDIRALVTTIEQIAGQQRWQVQTLEDMRAHNERTQTELRGLRGNLTILSLVSGVAMVLLVAAVMLIVVRTMLK